MFVASGTNLKFRCDLEISISTVSRALQNHPAIKHENIERIKKQAADFEYFADGVARSLRKNPTNTIGFIVSEIQHDYFSSAIDGI